MLPFHFSLLLMGLDMSLRVILKMIFQHSNHTVIVLSECDIYSVMSSIECYMAVDYSPCSEWSPGVAAFSHR